MSITYTGSNLVTLYRTQFLEELSERGHARTHRNIMSLVREIMDTPVGDRDALSPRMQLLWDIICTAQPIVVSA
jgi:hypothetical protein